MRATATGRQSSVVVSFSCVSLQHERLACDRLRLSQSCLHALHSTYVYIPDGSSRQSDISLESGDPLAETRVFRRAWRRLVLHMMC